ncbi:hypothetical protein EYF80_003488 [Liparis tanakae]|uniref:Uncharacterized protein n=1 Tax=Liparis tanakae TaxID=230148 RepID=A0A4Z2J7Z3_9TELE|nr:hypothetical protein EYF80_003488 [Liparis tanakae]
MDGAGGESINWCMVSEVGEEVKEEVRKTTAPKAGDPTLWGVLSSRWMPANWLMSGISSLKVYRGGLVGSGKLVLLNGSVSSKN